MNQLIKECVAGYEEGNGFVPATKIREFVWNVFAAHYIEMTKGRAAGVTVLTIAGIEPQGAGGRECS